MPEPEHVDAYLVAHFCGHEICHGWWLYQCEKPQAPSSNDNPYRWLARWLFGERYARDAIAAWCFAQGMPGPPEPNVWYYHRHESGDQVLAEWFGATFPRGLQVERLQYGRYRVIREATDDHP